MSFLQRLLGGLFGSGGSGRPQDGAGGNAFFAYVRCNACGEVIRVRVNREHDLSAEFEGESDVASGYHAHKEIVGRNCFRRIGLDLSFDSQRRQVDQRVTGGTVISREEFEAAQNADQTGADGEPLK
jgi:hypothetical protein